VGDTTILHTLAPAWSTAVVVAMIAVRALLIVAGLVALLH